MQNIHVVMPVNQALSIDARYDAALAYLVQKNATIHLVSVTHDLPIIYDETAHLRAQQEKVCRMTRLLKYETLDRLADSMTDRYPDLTFEYHVEADSFRRVIANLQHTFQIQCLLVDQRVLTSFLSREKNDALQYLVAITELPIWVVGPKATLGGDVLTALDLPLQNSNADRVNRLMIQTATHLQSNAFGDAHLVNCWTMPHFPDTNPNPAWDTHGHSHLLQAEQKLREERLFELIQDSVLTQGTLHIQVLEGAPEIAIPHQCEVLDIQLLVIGHNQKRFGPMGQTTADILTQIDCDALVIPAEPDNAQLFTGDSTNVQMPSQPLRAHSLASQTIDKNKYIV